MLPKINRLKSEKDFGKVLRAGKKIKENFLILKFIQNSEKHPRFGVSVSKKISKKATVRNKIRRRLLALCGAHAPGIKRNLDIAISALPGLENKSFPEIKKMVGDIFLKAGIV